MGCDIHMFIHYKDKESTTDWWRDFGGNINGGRDYLMFGFLAGVRHEVPGGLSAKGLPEHSLSWIADETYYTPIYEKETESEPNHRHSDEGKWEISLEHARSWERYGRKIIERDGKPVKIANPDYHSASWLTIKELSDVYRKYTSYCRKHDGWGKVSSTYKAVLQAMRSLEDDGKNDVELVFWFDN